MEDQTLNQRLYQLVAPHPSPYLSPSCKHGTILPPPQGSARCQLPHRSKVEGSCPVLFVRRYDWPICWPQPHLWPNLLVGWNIWYITSPSVMPNAGFLMLQVYKQALQKDFFSLELCMRMKIQLFGPFWPTWKRCMIFTTLHLQKNGCETWFPTHFHCQRYNLVRLRICWEKCLMPIFHPLAGVKSTQNEARNQQWEENVAAHMKEVSWPRYCLCPSEPHKVVQGDSASDTQRLGPIHQQRTTK